MFNKKYYIKNITAREILDSRGNPTIETTVTLDCGFKASASVPSGASTGIHEAVELRDNNKKRYGGLGVLTACQNVNKKIAPKLIGQNISELKKIDQLMIKLDGTPNKKRLGANAILSVSLACAKLGALANNLELYQYLRNSYPIKIKPYHLPTPMFNLINGGKHADSNLDIQEFMVVPIGLKNFAQKLEAGSEIFHVLGKILKEKKMDTDVGNEGGYAPNFKSTIKVLDILISAIKRAGYQPKKQIALALDVGASEIYDSKKKIYHFSLDKKNFTAEKLIEFYLNLIKKYPLISLEDPLAEDDFKNWSVLKLKIENLKLFENASSAGIPHAAGWLLKQPKLKIKNSLLIVGDDLFTTNPQRLKMGIKKGAANAVILKPNQIGTVSEAIAFGLLAKKTGYKIIASHRSGETIDDFIADLAVAIGADFVKFGAPSRGERVAKYNRLLEIANKITNSK